MFYQGMKTRSFALIVLILLFVAGMSGCSDNDYDPDDYVTSLLSGEYGKGQLWSLIVSENGEAVETAGYVRFESKDLKEANFRFVDVIPGESVNEFRNIPLSTTEKGVTFTIEFIRNDKTMTITGVVSAGQMTVDIAGA